MARSPSPLTPSIEFLPVSVERTATLHPEAQTGRIVENKVLTKAGTPMKRHIGKKAWARFYNTLTVLLEIALPERMEYKAGDYLSMYDPLLLWSSSLIALFSLPTNPPEEVNRALSRFAISHEQEVCIFCAVEDVYSL